MIEKTMFGNKKPGRTLKKVLSISIAAALCCAGLAGCSGVGNGAASGGQTGGEDTAAAGGEGVFVAPIAGIEESFIRGMDISSVLTEEASGVKYYDAAGNEEDLFKILSDNGVNYIRVRVWNDPYDKDGNGYGGGNNDAAAAAEIGRRAAENGMKLNVDFHYSDFWADPAKQMCPKAWEGMDVSEKASALYDYTVESLKTILAAGADVGMVQIGNEINNGMAGETKDGDVLELLKQGSKAVRDVSAEYGKDIKIAVHFTNVDASTNIIKKAKYFETNELDYDIYGISYYSFWHGSVEHMKETMDYVKKIYNKDVCVLETSFPYTDEDGDCSGNSVNAGDIVGDYICSPQSQANAVWDVMKAMADIGGLGVFYWESAWLPVGTEYESNMEIWTREGSGWASKYAAAYDPDDAGRYYGGSSWDNQAFFDFEGKLLDSISVFNYEYLKNGKEAEPKLEFTKDCVVELSQGEQLVMPEGVEGVYNDRSLNRVIPTEWNEEELAAIDVNSGGEHTVSGITQDGDTVFATVKVGYANLLANPGFEDTNVIWEVGYDMSVNPTDVQNKASDALVGDKAFHWWNGTHEQVFWVEQTIKAPDDGTYSAFGNIQGGDVGDNCVIKFYVKVNGEEAATDESVSLTGWAEWKKAAVSGVSASAGDDITVGMYVSCAAGGWGTMDEFCLYKD
ncbi:MAG: glycosyl hydrolase 53 family protein [Lachnospiraceae bacterium]|nr:glycosyl hydrolase 53 family protein [Lachnospiraceae bacterium]